MILPNTRSAAWVIPGIKYEKLPREQVIINEVLRHFNVDLNILKVRKRKKNIVFIRHIAMYLMCKYSGLSIAVIGNFFRRHHTSVMYARDQVIFEIDHSPIYKSTVEAIEYKISNRIKI